MASEEPSHPERSAHARRRRTHGADPVPDWYEHGQPHLWLPYEAMKGAAPLAVARTEGSRIVLADGRVLIDGIASWWTACHGYNHPHIRAAVERQLALMPHVMLGGMVHEPAATLARRLAALLPDGLDRVFFSDSGSVAVEVALKMAVQYWRNRGIAGRSRFVAFRGAYHGDTTGAMAVSDPEDGMHRLFAGMLPRHDVLDLPRDEASAARLERHLERHADVVAGIIVEPLVQGAGGMLFHDAAVLRRLRQAADRFEVLLICDEIFTGFGRTGTMFALDQAGVVPDIVTLSKALTGGTMALAATAARRNVFDAFWSDDPDAALMHGPTFMANPAGLRRRQCLARSVRAGAAPRAGGGDRSGAGARPRALPRSSGRRRCPGRGRDRRGRVGRHRRSRGAASAVRSRRRLGAAVRADRLSDAGLHHRRRRPRRLDRRGPPRADGPAGECAIERRPRVTAARAITGIDKPPGEKGG